MKDSTPDLPLDETALQAAAEHIWPSANLGSDEAREDLKRDVRAAIFTYLREAGIGDEVLALRNAQQVVDAQKEDGGVWFEAQTAAEAYLQQELRRLHSAVEGDPLGPVVQAAAEGTTKRIAEECDKGEVQTFHDPDSAAAYLRDGPVVQAESEEER